MSETIELTCRSPDATLAWGCMLGAALRGGNFVAIVGPLGAGKTVLAKGIARGLGVAAEEPVASPTFVLVREYQGRLRMYHLDAYRLSGATELFDLGLDEMLERPDSVVVLEWADRVPEAIPPGAWRIELEHAGGTTRRVRADIPDARRRAELAAAGAARGPDGGPAPA